MIETPRAFSPPMTSKSSSFSLGEREVVGSSKMMIFASFSSALEISTICRTPMGRLSTLVRGEMSRRNRSM